MIPNVDVDRISLEDRIKALEGRLPGGGTGLNSDFYIDPTVVDQCKDNAVTDIGSGLIVKIRVDDIGALQPSPSGGAKIHKDFSILAASFYPRINGVCHFMSSTLMRVQILRASTLFSGSPQSGTSVLSFPFDEASAQTHLFDHLHLGPDATNLAIYVWNGVQVIPYDSSQNTLSAGAHFNQFQGYVLFRRQVGVSLSIHTTIPSANPKTVYPCYCFGTCKYALAPIQSTGVASLGTLGGFIGQYRHNSMYGSYVCPTPQDLPNDLKPIYPASWYA